MGEKFLKFFIRLDLVCAVLLLYIFLNSCGTVSALKPENNVYALNFLDSPDIANIANVVDIADAAKTANAANFTEDIADSVGKEEKDINKRNKQETSEIKEIETQTETETETVSPDIYEINSKYNQYFKINEDIVGNIKINGTSIDFPVIFSGENEYYLSHDIYKNEYKHGSVFMDMSNHGAILDRNTILHGHNFGDGILFGDLENYINKDFFDSHKTIIFNNLYSDMEWEVFAVYIIDPKDYYLMISFSTEEEYFGFVNQIKSKALIWSDYIPKEGDHMLTLHTCSWKFKGSHILIHAKLVKKTDNLRNK